MAQDLMKQAERDRQDQLNEDSTDIAKRDPNTAIDFTALGSIEGTLERPRDIKADERDGLDQIGPNDIRLPRLCIAQGLSDQMLPDNSLYIENLHLFEMFNDVTSEIYGKGPLTLVPVRRQVKYVEYDPDNRGVPLDLDVPPGDPRTKWTKDADGESVPPLATEYVEFISLLLQPGKVPEPIVVSIKTTNKFNRRAAEQWTTFVALRGISIYRGMYHITSKSEKNDEGTFGVFVIKNAGFIPTMSAVGQALLKMAKEFHDSLKGKVIVVERETREPGDETSFDTKAMDAEAAQKRADDSGM